MRTLLRSDILKSPFGQGVSWEGVRKNWTTDLAIEGLYAPRKVVLGSSKRWAVHGRAACEDGARWVFVGRVRVEGLDSRLWVERGQRGSGRSGKRDDGISGQ